MDVEQRRRGQERLPDQLAEGADGPDLRAGRLDAGEGILLVDIGGLQQLQAQLASGVGGRRALHAAAAAAATIGGRHDERGPVRRAGKRPQDLGSELGGAQVDGAAHAGWAGPSGPGSPSGSSSSGGGG
jgi:hypothetical protein